MISVWGWSAKNKATSQKVLELPGCAICSVGCEILVLSQEEDWNSSRLFVDIVIIYNFVELVVLLWP